MLGFATHLAGRSTLPISVHCCRPASIPGHECSQRWCNNLQRQYLSKPQCIAMQADAGLPRHGGRVGVALHQPPHGYRQQTLRRQQLRRLCRVANSLATIANQ